MADPAIHITVLGSGTSSGVPTIGCPCAVCASHDPRDQRLRPSILIRYGGHGVLIDTTPDFRQQALRAHIERIDAIVYTHSHADHILGLDDVRPFNYLSGRRSRFTPCPRRSTRSGACSVMRSTKSRRNLPSHG